MSFNPQNPNGQATMANSAPVVIASNQSAIPVTGTVAITGVTQYTEGDTDASITGIAAMWEDGSDTLRAISLDKPLPVQPGTGATFPISAASLPLPTGAATEATLSTINGKLVTAKTADFDTGAGTDTVQMVGIALPASGGAVAGGTSSNPVRVDPTGTTTQPISAASLPLPSGAATEATLATIAAAVRAEDSASADGHTGIGALAIRKATPANTSGADGDYEFLQLNGGRLWVDASGVTLTVSGTVTSTPSGTQDVNVTKLAGTTVDTNSGNKSAGTLRIVIATDQPQLTNALKVDGSAVTQPVSGTVAVSSVGGTVTISGTATTTETQVVTDNAAFTDGTTKVFMGGYVFDETAGTALTENDAAAARIDSKRAQILVIEDATTRGQRAAVTAANALKVDGSAVTQPISGTVSVSGTVAVSIAATVVVEGETAHDSPANAGTVPLLIGGYANAAAPSDVSADGDAVRAWFLRNGAQATVLTAAGALISATSNALDVNLKSSSAVTLTVADNQVITDNAAFTDGTSKLFMGGYIFDETAGTALTENDAAAARIDSKRAQVFVLEDETTRGQRATVTSRKSMLIEGPTASGSSVAAAPVTTGGLAKTANPTAVSDGQVVNSLHDKLGKQVVVGSIRDLKGVQQTSISSSTSETTIVTSVASTFLDLYGLIITNTSSSDCKVTIKDATAGTTRMVFQIPPKETRGFTLPESGGHVQASSGNNWTATCGTSVATIEITAFFVKNL